MNFSKSRKGSSEEVFLVAKYDYTAQGSQELDLKKNERLTLLDDSKHWWKVLNSKNQSGFVPSNYVKREKPSIFDSIRKKVRKRTESKGSSNLSSPLSSPIATRTVDINIDGTSTRERNFDPRQLPHSHELNQQDLLGANTTATTTNTKETTSTTVAPQSVAVVKYNYDAQQSDELSLVKGSRIVVLEKSGDGWWKGEIDEKIGWFPSNYVVEEPIETGMEEKSFDNSASRSVLTSNSSTTNADWNLNGSIRNHRPQNPAREIVVALYPFTSQNKEELSFQKGQRLEIINKPANDPDWWMAQNNSGETGLVPKNYVQVISNNESDATVDRSRGQILNREFAKLMIPDTSPVRAPGSIKYHESSSDIQSQPWYFGPISRSQCDQMLNASGDDGDFLIRDSETNVSYPFSFTSLNYSH